MTSVQISTSYPLTEVTTARIRVENAKRGLTERLEFLRHCACSEPADQRDSLNNTLVYIVASLDELELARAALPPDLMTELQRQGVDMVHERFEAELAASVAASQPRGDEG